jgi:phosphoribosylamine--glycine ligase
VIKDDALAGGKGVTVGASFEEAAAAIRAVFAARPSARVVVEERLEGYEVSAHVFCDGRDFALMPFACDHKRLLDGDRGPNTGGMGVYAPPAISDALRQRIVEEIVAPTVLEMAAEGRPFSGVLYPGLMITAEGPKVLEYNCRFGDPETQPILMRLDSGLLEAFEASLDGRLGDGMLQWSADSTACVVIASAGYPGAFASGKKVSGLDAAGAVEGVKVFHAGSVLKEDGYYTAGGRVLGVTARGADLAQAVQRAYSAAEKIKFEGMYYRRDIAARALNQK